MMKKDKLMKHQNLLKGLIRLHILHHASEEEFYGQWMIQELAHHGYRLSPGTLRIPQGEKGARGTDFPSALSRYGARPGSKQGRKGSGPRTDRKANRRAMRRPHGQGTKAR